MTLIGLLVIIAFVGILIWGFNRAKAANFEMGALFVTILICVVLGLIVLFLAHLLGYTPSWIHIS